MKQRKEMEVKLTELNCEASRMLDKLLEGKYSEYTGWLNLPMEISNKDLQEIEELAEEVRANSDVLVVVGVGGSYLGSRAVIEAVTNKYNKLIEVIYLGNSISSLDLQDSLEYLKEKDFTVNVISKSGLTLEPALAFKFLRELMLTKYSTDEANERTIITTGKGVLKDLATRNDIEMFSIPEDVGGRYSALTAVGMLPMAVAGVDIERLISGARAALKLNVDTSGGSPAVKHASNRIKLMNEGKDIEILAYYEPRLKYFAEWWKQLYGESEGKEGKGLFPASACLTTDLHSLGQLIQDGKRNMFETHLYLQTGKEVIVPETEDNFDGLSYLEGKSAELINESAKRGTVQAHNKGGVPTLEVEMPDKSSLSEYSLGYLIYFFQLSCAISACLMKVNPFNQPGVEAYKANVTEILKEEVIGS